MSVCVRVCVYSADIMKAISKERDVSSELPRLIKLR